MSRALCLACALAAALEQPSTITDPRDNRVYSVVTIAGMTWLAGNLSFNAPGSSCPEGDNSCDSGRLYPWRLAMSACPPGWHLSTEEEWQRLERHFGMPAEELTRERLRGDGVGEALKVGAASKLDIPLVGWRQPDGSYREGNGNDHAAALWTATAADEESAWHRDVSSRRTGVWRSPVPFAYSLSVRCMRD